MFYSFSVGVVYTLITSTIISNHFISWFLSFNCWDTLSTLTTAQSTFFRRIIYLVNCRCGHIDHFFISPFLLLEHFIVHISFDIAGIIIKIDYPGKKHLECPDNDYHIGFGRTITCLRVEFGCFPLSGPSFGPSGIGQFSLDRSSTAKRNALSY